MTQQPQLLLGREREKCIGAKLIAYAITLPYVAGIIGLVLTNQEVGKVCPRFAQARRSDAVVDEPHT